MVSKLFLPKMYHWSEQMDLFQIIEQPEIVFFLEKKKDKKFYSSVKQLTFLFIQFL